MVYDCPVAPFASYNMLGTFKEVTPGIVRNEASGIVYSLPQCVRCLHYVCPCCETWCDVSDCDKCDEGICSLMEEIRIVQ